MPYFLGNMNSVTNNNTFNIIQSEIEEGIKRENDLRSEYSNLSTCSSNGGSNLSLESSKSSENRIIQNNETKGVQKTNGFRRFVPNGITKGVMQKFFKSRGKIGLSLSKSSEPQSVWISEEPTRMIIDKEKVSRNGFVPAKEKIVKELIDFKTRENELRKERFKSQPDLMASLDLELSELETQNGDEDSSVIKPARSMAVLYQSENGEQEYNSAPCSLKPARSLAALCDVSDDEIDNPGEYLVCRNISSKYRMLRIQLPLKMSSL